MGLLFHLIIFLLMLNIVRFCIYCK